jgi:hypothetical protein
MKHQEEVEHTISCIDACNLQNPPRRLTPAEQSQLDQHLAGCDECREYGICCSDALDLIDTRDSLTPEMERSLEHHIECCSDCCGAYRIERVIRDVFISEPTISISPDFEQMLAARLNLTPVVSPVVVPPSEESDPITKWGWVIGSLTISLLAAYQLPNLKASSPSLSYVLKVAWAWLASHLTGNVAVVFDSVATLSFPGNMLYTSLMLGLTTMLIGGWAFRTAWQDE